MSLNVHLAFPRGSALRTRHGSIAEVEHVKRGDQRQKLPGMLRESSVRKLEMLDNGRRGFETFWDVVEKAQLALARFETVHTQPLYILRGT